MADMPLHPESDGIFIKKKHWQELKFHALTPYLLFEGGVHIGLRPFNYSTPRSRSSVFLYSVEYAPKCWHEGLSCSHESYLERITSSGSDFIYETQSRILNDIDWWTDKGYNFWHNSSASRVVVGLRFFKTGLSAGSAKARGKGEYTVVYQELEIDNPYQKIDGIPGTRAAQIETIVRFALFLDNWREVCWFYSPRDVYIGEPISGYLRASHVSLRSYSAGLRESWLIANADQKNAKVLETFKWASSLNNKDLASVCNEILGFASTWNLVSRFKASSVSFSGLGSRKYFEGSHPSLYDFLVAVHKGMDESWEGNPISDWLLNLGFQKLWAKRSYQDLLDFVGVEPSCSDLCLLKRSWLG